jgi:hypothetical protein
MDKTMPHWFRFVDGPSRIGTNWTVENLRPGLLLDWRSETYFESLCALGLCHEGASTRRCMSGINAGSPVCTEETAIGSLVGKPPDRNQAQVDGG